MPAHPLDRPVWSALTTRQSGLALGDARALRIRPDYGPFGAAADASAESLAALAGLITEVDPLWVVETGDAPVPRGIQVRRRAELVQMTAEAMTAGTPPRFAMIDLVEADAAEMRALAHLTEPGPFLAMTHRLGAFVGVKQDGRLVAMSGERMRPEGFTEVSAVCTHPDCRGRGYAGALMRVVMGRILDRGETPFLHAYASNAGAIGLYETLGFKVRRPMVSLVLALTGASNDSATPR